MASRQPKSDTVVFLNPKTCGLYKKGLTKYRVDPTSGQRTETVDDELNEHVEAYLKGVLPPGASRRSLKEVQKAQVIVPTYYDPRYLQPFRALCEAHALTAVSIGELLDEGTLQLFGGHGSPGNDQRVGTVPYIKVSDLRALRVNINPTNRVPLELARKFWGNEHSGLSAWDLISPNRASSNIGEFALLLPGEEEVLITKEVFILRIAGGTKQGWSPFYLLWALSLTEVRNQWRRVTLMQTNREDVGQRYREILLPRPSSPDWAASVSGPFRDYFSTVAESRTRFSSNITELSARGFTFIPSVRQATTAAALAALEEAPEAD
ncbi:MAG: hypothetical protein IT348_16210 [Candidatus Eisenbacteria bacterium]|nr:hypothetical protein [Candidatus Eisenbacteria bacterium]